VAGPIYAGNSGYTPLSTIGTQTVNQGPGVLYGFNLNGTGTTWNIAALDIFTAGTTTVTNTLFSGAASGANLPAGVPGIGIRYRGSLVVVTTGTAGAGNTLWD
jgi:hypothetical protein